MKVSLSWLSSHLDLSGHSPDSLADLLTFAGVEVEGIHSSGIHSDLIVVGKVTSFIPHPNADKLRLCQVDDGSPEPRQIVCGAKNFAPGDCVPVALPGAVLPGNFTIKESELRGVLSRGMMCSSRELGLGDNHEGLMILPSDAPVGRPLHQFIPSDTLFEVEITPNRPDLLSHRGMARELAALASLPLLPTTPGTPGSPRPASSDEISLADPAGCPFYSARRISGVKIVPSPDWLRQRLESVGLRPINNVVDVTNFVLMETGQPLHAFDASTLTGPITVRRAHDAEPFTTLDGKSLALDPLDLVIADPSGPLALAGVMGGAHSGVTDSTTDILLEAAYFHTSSVRRTSRRLSIHSDSSYRFERGVDPDAIIAASDLAVRLILETAGGTASPDLLIAGSPPKLTGTVPLDPDHVRRLLGTPIPDAEIDRILSCLGLAKSPSGWIIPSYRQDLTRPVDLIEEIARVHGIENLPAAGAALFSDPSTADEQYDFRMNLRKGLAARGLWEAQTIKLVSHSQLDLHLGTNPQPLAPLPLKNPLSDDHTVMRPGLIPGLLAVAERNIRMGRSSLRFFESGTVFASAPDGKPIERDVLSILISGPAVPPSWAAADPASADLFDLRGLIESLFPAAQVKWKPGRIPAVLLAGGVIQINGKSVGLGGRLHPARERAIGTRLPVFIAELDSAALQKAVQHDVLFDDLPRFPSITRDVAIESAADLPNSKFEDFFASLKEPHFTGASVFDVFSDPSGAKLAAGRKSIAYSLTYRDRSRTLEGSEVDAAHQRILAALQKALPVTIR